MYMVSRKYIIVIHKIHVADVISCIYYLVIVTILRYGICIFFGVILLCYLCVIFSFVLPYAGQFVAPA